MSVLCFAPYFFIIKKPLISNLWRWLCFFSITFILEILSITASKKIKFTDGT